MSTEPDGSPYDPAVAARNDWLITALGAFLISPLLLYIAGGSIACLDGIAAITCLITAITAAVHAFRRARQIRHALKDDHPLPRANGAIGLVAALTTVTALLALTAIIIHR